MLKIISLCILIFFPDSGKTFGQSGHRVSLVFGGDVMCHQAQLVSAFDSVTKEYQFGSYFTQLRALFERADLVAANLETTLANDRYSGYPAFRSPDKLASDLRQAGFNFLFTANNHSLDQGTDGLIRTIRILNQHQFYRTGTFLSAEEKEMIHPLLIRINGHTLAFLNYTYGSNVAFPYPAHLVNLIDTAQIRNDVLKSQQAGATAIICYVHWGNEYEENPSAFQDYLADYLRKLGVTIIVGSHPHVVQPVELVQNQGRIESLCAYSLGNLISNQREGKKKEGMLLEISLDLIAGKSCIAEVHEHPTLVVRTGSRNSYNYLITLPFWPAPN